MCVFVVTLRQRRSTAAAATKAYLQQELLYTWSQLGFFYFTALAAKVRHDSLHASDYIIFLCSLSFVVSPTLFPSKTWYIFQNKKDCCYFFAVVLSRRRRCFSDVGRDCRNECAANVRRKFAKLPCVYRSDPHSVHLICRCVWQLTVQEKPGITPGNRYTYGYLSLWKQQ